MSPKEKTLIDVLTHHREGFTRMELITPTGLSWGEVSYAAASLLRRGRLREFQDQTTERHGKVLVLAF